MKKLLLLFAAISVYLLLPACGDDNKPADSDLCGRELPFGKRLSNQTKNVLLPLEVGREWHYKVTRNGVISYDTIKVLSKEKCADGEWYRVKFPLFDPNPILMINTTTGLWRKCNGYNDEMPPLTVGDYPKYNMAVSYGLIYPMSGPIHTEKGEEMGVVNAMLCLESTKFTNLKENGKLYSGNQIIHFVVDCGDNAKFSDTTRFYFTPGFGLIKLTHRSSMDILYELID